MGRRKLEWSDAELRLIIATIHDSDQAHPRSNDRFLDAVLEEIRAITGSLYGAATYERLIRSVPESMSVTRRPSRTTIQKAVERAQAAASASDDADLGAMSINPQGLRHALTPVLKEVLSPLHALLADVAAKQASPQTSGGDPARVLELELTRAALTDVHDRLRQRDEEIVQLRVDLGRAQAARSLAEEHMSRVLVGLDELIRSTGANSEQLVNAMSRLSGTEQFLKLHADAVRLQATAETDRLREKTKALSRS